ncbi:MAG: recombinase family protein [Bacteroidetes bacterium]|nr:recombinase family protein [Bacteroidota bacterium]
MKRPAHSTETKYVAYYRVSTKKQGKSGLGLDAQRDTVQKFIKRNGDRIIAEFTEVESGKNNDRLELSKAIEMANENDATLVIAKLDRLSRNVSFISQLMDEKVKFVCCDMPEANELTIHIFAAMAQFERKRISERIKEALDAKRVREPDWKPGNPQNLTKEARQMAYDSISRKAREDKGVRHAFHFIRPLREQGLSYDKIAAMLNKEKYRTRRGKKFSGWQVWNIYKRFENENI